jgi:hypothetical protein
VKPRPSAGAIRRSVNSADQKGVGSGRATVTEFMTDVRNGSLSVPVPAQQCTAPHVLKKGARGSGTPHCIRDVSWAVIARSKATKQLIERFIAQAIELDSQKSGWQRLQCDRLEPVVRLSAE